jgi:hypothetical protein
MNQFPKTDRLQVNQCPAVGASAIGPKGLGTGGDKPLMKNHRASFVRGLRDRDTAGHTLQIERV